jgi:hypothetical protein
MAEVLRPCKTGTCNYVNEKVPTAQLGWVERCEMVASRIMEISPEMNLEPTECPHAVAYAWADSQMATTQGLSTEGVA